MAVFRVAALAGVIGGVLGAGTAFAQDVVAPATCDDARFLADRHQFQAGNGGADLPEHVCGTVTRVNRARHTRSGNHGYFMVNVGKNVWVKIVSDLDEMDAPQWPWVKTGDGVDVVGRYYYDNPHSQGIDWTHHGVGRSWSVPGYVVVNGTKYQ